MTDEEMKRIHGEDVELAPDDSEDDKLTEEDALAQAAAQGIYFKDTYVILRKVDLTPVNPDGLGFERLAEAEAELAKLDNKDDYMIAQKREQVTRDTQNEQSDI